MHPTSHAFPENAKRALNDETLQYMLRKSGKGFQEKRATAAQRLPEFEALRDQARDLKNHVLEHLDVYLEAFEAATCTGAARGRRRATPSWTSAGRRARRPSPRASR